MGLCLIMFCGLTIRTAAAQTKLSAEEAQAIAMDIVDLEEVGPVTSVELEEEDGITVYAVEFTMDGIQTDIKIDADTGEVVAIKSDLDEMTEGTGEAEDMEEVDTMENMEEAVGAEK